MSQEQLADLAGVSRLYIGQIETGAVHEPTVSRARRIERAVGVEPYDLLLEQRPRRRAS